MMVRSMEKYYNYNKNNANTKRHSAGWDRTRKPLYCANRAN